MKSESAASSQALETSEPSESPMATQDQRRLGKQGSRERSPSLESMAAPVRMKVNIWHYNYVFL